MYAGRADFIAFPGGNSLDDYIEVFRFVFIKGAVIRLYLLGSVVLMLLSTIASSRMLRFRVV